MTNILTDPAAPGGEQPTQKAIEGVGQTDILKEVEGLWQDPTIVSYSLRRHGNYERNPDSGMRGALHAEGIAEARERTQDWTSSLPDGAEVTIFESPSHMTAKHLEDPETGEQRPVNTQRARITASLYETALFGRQEPGRRVTEPLLGDFLETATTPEEVGAFYAEIGKTYGKLTPEFWEHYVRGELAPEITKALERAGGVPSQQLAANLITWLEKSPLPASNETPTKQVGLAVTHGETIHAFLYQLSHYLEQTGQAEPEVVQAFRQHDPDYHEGMDLHVAGDQVTIVVANQHTAAVRLDDFKHFLLGSPEQTTTT